MNSVEKPDLAQRQFDLSSLLPISAVILAGGQSQRLGLDKRRLRLWGEAGETLLEHTIRTVAQVCNDMIVVMNDPDEWPNLPARRISDIVDGGALGGLYTGLEAAANPFVLAVAADMPFLNLALLKYMLAYPRTYDALVPRTADDNPTRNHLAAQTLHAIYCRETRGTLRSLLDQGVRRISDYLTAINTVFIDPETICQFDPDGQSFININTPDDHRRVQQMISAER
jgi:molybdenum cofactor guanylyltransferase